MDSGVCTRIPTPYVRNYLRLYIILSDSLDGSMWGWIALQPMRPIPQKPVQLVAGKEIMDLIYRKISEPHRSSPAPNLKDSSPLRLEYRNQAQIFDQSNRKLYFIASPPATFVVPFRAPCIFMQGGTLVSHLSSDIYTSNSKAQSKTLYHY